ncbi:MAG: hypothetical protein F6J87_04530 [Spirulina sp. SIO3F2]|nr:hypothetical protein [Spirulina sp. SIO3F2]
MSKPESPLPKPKFRSNDDWELAQILMQPSLIRIVDNLTRFLQDSAWQGEFEETQVPEPGFILVLNQDGQPSQQVLLWELCFRVCFTDYPPPEANPNPLVTVDRQFLESDGDIAWSRLDQKTDQVLTEFFAQLPTGTANE